MIYDAEHDIQGRLFDRKLTLRLLHYVKPYASRVVLAIFLLMGVAATSAYIPILMKVAIDDHISPAIGSADAHLLARGLWSVAGLLAGLLAVGFFLRYGQNYLMNWIGQHIIFDLRSDVFRKILHLPLSFIDRNPVGRLMTRVTSDVEAMQRLISDGLVGLIADVFTLMWIVGFMLMLNARLTLVMMLVMPALIVTVAFLNLKIRRAHRRVLREQSALNSFLQEMITGMLTVQLFTREKPVQERFDERNNNLCEAGIDAIRWFSLFFPAVEVLNAVAFSLVLCVGGAAILAGSETVSIGILFAFLMYIRDFFRPLEDLSEKSNILQAAMASSERIFGLMDMPQDVVDPEHPAAIDHFKGKVDFEDVWFSYVDDDWVLKNLRFTIQPGESIAIVGATGAGKTSITSLISRFYDVQKGSVRIDGKDVRDYRQAELRRKIGVVLQDPFVFSGSIASNISMHNPNLSREQIEETARYVNAEGFIKDLPEGYDTRVQERGVTLSTGQKQLLALARALVQDPDILLILDEATANVDTETERLIQDALNKLMQGRTSIIIAHRLSTIRDVNRIFVMRQGRIIEEGSHANLVAEGGYYKQLYELLSHTPGVK